MRSQAEFSLGGRNAPWWAASVAVAAGEISTLTLVGLPAAAFRGGWGALQVLIGSTAARLLVASVLLPPLFGAASPSIYGFLGERVGPRTRAAAASLFVVTRLLSGAARLMAGGIVVSALLDCPLWAALFPLAAASGVILTAGGVRAVVWLGFAQAVAAVVAAAGAIGYLAAHVEGGLAGIWVLASQQGSLDVLKLAPSDGHFFADPSLLWACVFSGLFGGAASFCADQETAQRLLCARGEGEARRALIVSVAWSALIVILYLFLGSGLFAFYRLHPGVSLPARVEHLFPQFAATVLPPALRLLVLVSVSLVALDLPLVGMATAIVSDGYRLIRPRLSERRYLGAARLTSAALAALLAVVAWLFARAGGSLWVALKISAITLGPLLGAFIAAERLEAPSDRATAGALIAMVAVCAILLALSERGSIALASTWLVVYGTIGTAGLAWGLAPLIK